MERIIYIAIATLALSIFASCSTSRPKAEAQDVPDTEEPTVAVMQPQLLGGSSSEAMPKAVIYRMNGDYAQYVPVTLSASRTSLVSFPAPTDLSIQSEPLPLGDGWYLDRRGGISTNTAFLRYTYPEYMALEHTPAPSQLLLDVNPKARVTRVVVLPITINQALDDPESVRQYIPKE